MKIDLAHKTVLFVGEPNPVGEAALAALVANEAAAIDGASEQIPDILIVSLPLLPKASPDVTGLLNTAREVGAAMAARGHGRILFLVSAIAGTPMRRHPDFSVALAPVLATVRTLAMQLGPWVLVNAVGVGAIGGERAGEPLLGGDAAMLQHASAPGPGRLEHITGTVLFFCDPLNSYTTGQMLSVDGGWSAGYGRNF